MTTTDHQQSAPDAHDGPISMRLVGGIALVVGGVVSLLAGLLHPTGGSSDFRQAIVNMLTDPSWPASHWLALTSMLIIVVALWVLADDGWTGTSVVARLGARLAMVSGFFMMVEFAVEYAARSSAAPFASGIPVAGVQLAEPMQAVGWPALNAGIILLVLGLPKLAPLPIRLLAIAGSALMGVAGVLTMGLHIAAAGPLFIGGAPESIWWVWIGVRTALAARPAPEVRAGAVRVTAPAEG
jgi:hypothetical protein